MSQSFLTHLPRTTHAPSHPNLPHPALLESFTAHEINSKSRLLNLAFMTPNDGPLLTSPVSFQLPFLFLYLLLPHRISLISSNVPCPTLPRIFHMMYPLLRMFFSSQSHFLPSYFLILADSQHLKCCSNITS